MGSETLDHRLRIGGEAGGNDRLAENRKGLVVKRGFKGRILGMLWRCMLLIVGLDF